MLLKDATSKEEVEIALEEGDEDLEADIEEELDYLKTQVLDRIYEYGDWEDFNLRSLIRERAPEVTYELSDRLEGLTEERIISELISENAVYARLEEEGPKSSVDIYLFSFFQEFVANVNIYAEISRYIPENIIEKFLEKNFHMGCEIDGNWLNCDDSREIIVYADFDKVQEIARDRTAIHFEEFIEEDFSKALDIYLNELSEVDMNLYSALRKQISDIPEEDLKNFMLDWMVSGDKDTSVLEDYLSGIKRITESFYETDWLEGRKAYLHNLSVADLRAEGTDMRHCVGDPAMGYAKAVATDEIQIWSLRLDNGKRLFTFEVDISYWDQDNEEQKATAISQIKGKGNRLPGFVDKDKTGGLQRPHEVELLYTLLSDLGVRPELVKDLQPGIDALQQKPRKNPSYRDTRSFDKPYRPVR